MFPGIFLISQASALTCAPDEVVCEAVDAAIAAAHLAHGDDVMVVGAPARLDPDRMLARIEQMVDEVSAAGCTVDGSVWVGGAYNASVTSGDVGDTLGVFGSASGVLDHGTKSFTGLFDGELMGETVSRYDRNGRVVASIGADGRFFAGRWARVRGRNGVMVGLRGTCDPGGVAVGLDRYMRGALLPDGPTFEVRLTDGDQVLDTGFDADTIELIITGGDQSYDFGFGQTKVQADGGFGWFGEDCFTGSFCHPTSPTGVTLTRTDSIPGIVPGSTTLIPIDFPESTTPALTYFVGGSSACWVWGDDPTYYSSLGCELADATVVPAPVPFMAP